MGNKVNSKKNRQISMVETARMNNVEGQTTYENNDQRCCCFLWRKRVKIQKDLTWKQKFINSCTQVKQYNSWAPSIIVFLKNNHFMDIQFKNQVTNLKQRKFMTHNDQEILLTPSEMDAFKDNLKSSVILSSANMAQGRTVRDTLPKRYSKLQTQLNVNKKISKVARGSVRLDYFRKSVLVDNNKTVKGKSMLRQSLMSFVDDTISNLFRSDKQVTKKGAYYLQIFVSFTMILERHFNNPQHPFCKIKKLFIENFVDSFSITNPRNRKVSEQKMEEIVNNVKQFLAIFQQGMINFYDLQNFDDKEQQNYILGNQQNLQTVITAILFKDKTFYNHIFNLVQIYNFDRQILFLKMIQWNRGKTPSDFDVKKQYWLSEPLARMSSLSKFQDKLDRLALSEIQSKHAPYYECLEALKSLQKTQSPISKMKIIMQCSQKITESISKYYNQNNMLIQQWVLDADQVLSIFCYIIISSEVPNLHSHLYILQHFATDHQLISITGYYYSVLMCALEQLERSYSQHQTHIKNML